MDNRNLVIVALHDQFSGTSIQDFIIRHHWQPETEFHITHVIESSAPPRPGDPRWEGAKKQAVRSASMLVGEFAESIRKLAPDCHVQEHVLEGIVADELVRLAQEQIASLIIMGCRGRTGIKRLL